MHDGSYWGGWGHWFPGFGHGTYGLLILVLIAVALAVLVRSLFRKKD